MKRGLILSVFLIILIISISFISANPFTDFFKKLTGQAIEQAKTPIQNQITQIQSITPEPVPTASNIVKCSDSDGKSNFLESGYVNFNSKTYYDYCDNNLAYDYYCPSSSNIVANVIKIIGNAITEQTAPDKTSKDCTSYGTNYQCSEGKCIKVGDCLNGETKPCEINIGACKPGVQVCVNFYWSECQNQILPSTEICDSIDNDCDNLIDEINCTIVQNQTNQTIPTHKTCLGNSCISINGQGTDECYFDDQCIVNETTPIEKPNFFAGILGIASETPETQEEINPVYSNKPITKTTYIYAGNLVASKKNNESETTYYVQDHLGSNRKVVDGQIEEQSTDFYAFGETKETTGDSENDYLYTGKELDETGLYYYGARYYNPELGRFTQPDSLTGSLADPLSMNRYSYVQNNPLKYVDPTGNKREKPLKLTHKQVELMTNGLKAMYGSLGDNGAKAPKEATKGYLRDVLSGIGVDYQLRILDLQSIFPNSKEDLPQKFSDFVSKEEGYAENKKLKTSCAGFVFYVLSEFAKEQGTTLQLTMEKGTSKYLPEDAVIQKKDNNPGKRFGTITVTLDPNKIPLTAYKSGPLASTLNIPDNSVYAAPTPENMKSGAIFFKPRKGASNGHVVIITNSNEEKPVATEKPQQ